MIDDKAVMQMALDALLNTSDFVFKDISKSDSRHHAIVALRKAIAQPAHAFIASDAIKCVAQPVQHTDVPETDCGNIAQPAAERNFCPRCGKRLGGVDDVHTCTLPVSKANS